MSNALRVLAVIACATMTLAARANDRYAIVIGHNLGGPDEPRLMYAERDAQRVADVLTRVGGVAAENLLLLLGPDPDDVTRALASFAQRMTSRAEAGPPIVFVYYSGHADSLSLHLGRKSLQFSNFKAAVRAVGADVSVVVVDACRSGGLMRVKGAAIDQPFAIDVQDQLASEGFAIVTSSSESEDAQESERLGGGVFTHHFLVGLLGAADSSADRKVTLDEAYRYAYTQTLATTSASAVVQHPTYAFDLRGRDELVVTWLDATAGLGRVRLEDAGHYFLIERFGQRSVAAEVEARAATELVLPPGRYLVRRRDSDAVYETELEIRPDQLATVAPNLLERLAYRHVVRKGYGVAVRRALSLGADLEVAGPVVADTGVLVGGAITLQLDLSNIALRARVRYAQSRSENAHLALDQHLVGIDLGIYHVFDLGPHGLGFGVRGGLDWLAQRFDSDGLAPDRNLVVGRVGPFARAELALGPSVALQLDLGAEMYLVDTTASDGTTALQPRVVPTAALGFGIQL